MPDLHRLLARQLRRHLGADAELPPDLRAFVEDVDRAYRANDEDRHMLERAMDLSSQELMGANAELAAMLRAFPDSFLWLDGDDRIVRCSADDSTGEGSCGPELRGRSLLDRFEVEHRGAVEEALVAVRSAGGIQTVEIQQQDGSALEIRLSPVREGQVLAVLRDISARKKAERELIAAKEAAETAVRAKSEFLATMSHEIRTPLNAMIGMLSLLEQAELGAQEMECVETALGAGESLLQIINDILDFSRCEAGRLQLERIPLNAAGFVGEVVEMLRNTADEESVEIGFEAPPDLWCDADPTRLRQVLWNLIGNALKFTSRGRVRTTVSGRGGRVYFEVSDTGIGIPSGHQADLFEPFRQGDGSTTRRFGGTGLGLAITRRFVEGMGGSIELESREGEGSTFTFHLPRTERPAGRTPETNGEERPPSEDPVKGRTVLLVEDNLVNQRVAMRMLAKLGCEVAVAANGEEALEHFRQRPFDVVLMDCQMPVLDGYEATARLRSEHGTEIPVLGVTANAFPSDIERCRESGMDDVLPKPIRLEELRRALGQWLR